MAAELESYAVCVDNHPSSWNIKCAEKKAALTACASKQCAAPRRAAAHRMLRAQLVLRVHHACSALAARGWSIT